MKKVTLPLLTRFLLYFFQHCVFALEAPFFLLLKDEELLLFKEFLATLFSLFFQHSRGIAEKFSYLVYKKSPSNYHQFGFIPKSSSFLKSLNLKLNLGGK